MRAPSVKPVRCAIYTRVSTEHGLDQEFNSLDAQYDAGSAYIKSQAHAGWNLIRSRYDDGGYSGHRLKQAGIRLGCFVKGTHRSHPNVQPLTLEKDPIRRAIDPLSDRGDFPRHFVHLAD